MKQYLGFDFGLRRIGVAVGQTITGTASALDTVHYRGNVPWADFQALIEQWRPSGLVVGAPLTMAGEEQPITVAAKRFATELERFNLPVYLCDERLSSREAEANFKQARQAGHAKRQQGKNLDSVAAKIILERWMVTQS